VHPRGTSPRKHPDTVALEHGHQHRGDFGLLVGEQARQRLEHRHDGAEPGEYLSHLEADGPST